MNTNYYTYPYYYTRGIETINPMLYNMPKRSPFSFLRTRNPISTITKPNKFSFSNLLNGASKTLGVINQAIPVVNQVKPIWKNAKTMLRMVKVMNTSDDKEKKEVEGKDKKVSTQGPTFFN